MIPSATVQPVIIIIFKQRLFYDILKSGDECTDENKRENNDPYRP